MKTRVLTILLLVAVCAFAWLNFLSGLGADTAEQSALLEQAAAYRQVGLYQLAMDSCYDAIAVKADPAAYDFLIAVGRDYYAEDPDGAYYSLLDAYQAATGAYPKQAAYWEGYVQMYLDDESYSQAGTLLRRADSYGAQSPLLDSQWQTACYAYRELYQGYLQMSALPQADIYAVQQESGWGAAAAGGSAVLNSVFAYVAPVGPDGYLLAVTAEGETRVMNDEGVLYGRFSAPVVQARAYSEGLAAVQLEGRQDWCFVDAAGAERLGGYLQAGMFQDGVAAVQQPQGQWQLIDTQGAPAAQGSWDEILLFEDGAYQHDGRMVVRTGQSWMLCDTDGVPVGEGAYEAMDICLDGAVAFCQNGRWGFLDRDGTVLLQPVYQAARSFSGGVAAVCQDGKWGFIDAGGDQVIGFVFDDAAYFSADNNCCRVRLADSGEYSLIQWQIDR